MANSPFTSITTLLQKLRPGDVTAKPDEVASAISKVFASEVSAVQVALLLDRLSVTSQEQEPNVLAECAKVMRAAAERVDVDGLQRAIKQRQASVNAYEGGLCDIVGTGGDYHSTFNISTASSIIASSVLLVAKHGNRASTSKSGSADVLACMQVGRSATSPRPNLEAVTPVTLPALFSQTNFVFLFAPNFHKGLKPLSSIRKELPSPSIFNLLGPLTNPADALVEARVIGVKRRDLLHDFAEALRLNGTTKGMIVCGAEDLDEISCAGPTYCARLSQTKLPQDSSVVIEEFILTPADFGLPMHALETVSPGQTAQGNAEILGRLLRNEMSDDDAILHFVLMNVASLFCIAGACDGDVCALRSTEPVIKERGPGHGRWKEGVRLARRAIKTGAALKMLQKFTDATIEIAT
ncbi:MAG: anthranilate phosphoribosyltransferase [Chrysothrix sp. TS-e1954]|nr:MAG: anthranilate phosphoribosyltransferase [Chrysothrix sp. TS-e1954]